MNLTLGSKVFTPAREDKIKYCTEYSKYTAGTVRREVSCGQPANAFRPTKDQEP